MRHNFVQTNSLLQEGVSCAIATTHAILSSHLFENLPEGDAAQRVHNHGLWLLTMLSSHLSDLQHRVDQLDEESASASIPPPTIPTAFRIAADHNVATVAWFNGLPNDLEARDPVAHAAAEERLTDALNGVEEAPIATLHELTEAISIGCDGGTTSIEPDFACKLLAAARALAGER